MCQTRIEVRMCEVRCEEGRAFRMRLMFAVYLFKAFYSIYCYHTIQV